MNDPTYVEAARKLAEQMMSVASAPSERIAIAFRKATGRPPRAEESDLLKELYGKQFAKFSKNPQEASNLLGVGESESSEHFDDVELASWSMVASVILNLDEVITKN